MPRINLLPWREAQRKERKLAFGVALLGATFAAALVAGAIYLLFGSMIDAQIERNDRLKTEIALLDKQIEEINSLEAQKQQFISRMEIIEKLQRSRPEVVHLFDEIVRALPDGAYLTAVKQTGSRLRIDGVAQSSTRVSAFMRNIDASQWLEKPELAVVETRKDQPLGATFTLYADQVSTAGGEEDAEAARPTRRAQAGSANGGRAQ